MRGLPALLAGLGAVFFGFGMLSVGHTGPLGGRVQDRHEEIGVVVAALALEDRDDPLQTHPGVNARCGERHDRGS